ncbi:MAG: type II toxin-antitoxin system RelE/ParE family toxin [Alphaproteobacteria bacterium]|jgi:proteic killer suppression protein|nr:type II toxin-antitoxin system RelE/ParE family toxin [Alphaproteobacteria bacterium]
MGPVCYLRKATAQPTGVGNTSLDFCTVSAYDYAMEIRSISHRGLRRLLERNDASGISGDLEARLRRILTALVLSPDAESILGPPGWRIHQLRGKRTGTWSIGVSGNWRIAFKVREGCIVDLDLEDYH